VAPRPRDDTDAVNDIARDLAEVAAQIASFNGEANAWLTDPNYDTLRLRLETAHSAVEAATDEAGAAERGTRAVSRGAQAGAEKPWWRRIFGEEAGRGKVRSTEEADGAGRPRPPGARAVPVRA
jgi:hypothetical protein